MGERTAVIRLTRIRNLVFFFLLIVGSTGSPVGAYASSATTVTLTVTTAADSGAGSLRAAIVMANNIRTAAVTISFHIGSWGSQQTITVLNALPAITKASILLDGRTQSGGTTIQSPPLIRIDNGAGARATSTSIPGLQLGRFDTVNDLDLTGFGDGFTLQPRAGAVNCWLGVDQSGSPAANYVGVYIARGNNASVSNPVLDNVISGNVYYGVQFAPGASGWMVRGNKIGTDPTGSYAIPNGSGFQPPY